MVLTLADNAAMPALTLSSAQRREHRAMAHHLDPAVMVGADGVSAAVRREINAALDAQGLIKVRLQIDDRAAREKLCMQLADELDAALVQHIGKLVVLWRAIPEKEKPIDDKRGAGPKDVKVLKFSKRGGQRPEVKTLRVLGNQRLTSGGRIKRAKPKPVSVKKRQSG